MKTLSTSHRAPWQGWALAALAWTVFGALALAMHQGLTVRWDEALLHAAQGWRATHPKIESVMRDFSALGGTAVLTLFTVLAVAYLCSVGRPARAAVVAVAMAAGALMVSSLKALFGRARPDADFAALVQEGLSFPSGHASMSAVFYLTVGVLIAQRHGRPRERVFLLGVAVAMALLIGATRVVLGVHWASDVMAGWAFGAGWAAMWFQLAAHLRDARRT